MVATNERLLQHLANYKIIELLEDDKPPMISVHQDSPIKTVLQTMHTHNIISVPVYKTAREFTAIVTVHDILSHALFNQVFDCVQNTLCTPRSREEFKEYFNGLKKEHGFFNTAVKEINVKEYVRVFGREEAVTDLLDYFTSGHHRRALFAFNGAIQILTQSDLLKFIYYSIKDTPMAPLDQPLENADRFIQGKAPIVTISKDIMALEGFKKLHTHGVAALAVTDEEGKLTYTLSGADLRGITLWNIGNLLEPLEEYIQVSNKPPKSPVVQHPHSIAGEAVMADAIQMMLHNRIHRVWICDQEGKPIGVVTFSDILSLINR